MIIRAIHDHCLIFLKLAGGFSGEFVQWNIDGLGKMFPFVLRGGQNLQNLGPILAN